MREAAAAFGAKPVSPEKVLGLDVDVLAPCAMGGVLNRTSIPRIRARVIAGDANNQLAETSDADALMRQGVLYAPDYVINAVGIIAVTAEYRGDAVESSVRASIHRIPLTLATVLSAASVSGRPPSSIADDMAEAVLRSAGARSDG